MSQVADAFAAGKASLAVSGALLRDPEVMLALKDRGAAYPMALSGPAVAPVVPVGDLGVSRALTAGKGGVVIVVEPGNADQAELDRLGGLLATAAHKPRIVVVAKRYDMLRMAMSFRGLKVDHVKERGQAFLRGLPLLTGEAAEAPAEVPKAKERRKKSGAAFPKPTFVGRDDEVAALSEALGTGGPLVVVGPRGVGKRQVVEHAIAGAGLTRLPDLFLSRDTGFDTLIGRLAAVTQAAGSETLVEALKGETTPLQKVEAAVAALGEAAGTDGQVMVVHNLQIAAGRSGDFFRCSRLELLCQALLTASYPLRLVFTSLVAPVFFREGRDASLRRFALQGIKGRNYHDLFEAYFVEDFPRDRFGPISERIHGHPVAVRTFAIAVRHDERLGSDDKFFRMKGLDDEESLRKQLEKRVQRLDDVHRDMLAFLAHLRYPVDGKVLADLDIARKHRAALLSEGVLEVIAVGDAEKTYFVHPLVRRCLSRREADDFNRWVAAADVWRKLREKAEGVEKLAYLQEERRALVRGRRLRDLPPIEVPDHDVLLDTAIGMMRAKNNPRLDLAERRLGEVLKADPGNSDAWLLELERLRRSEAPRDAVKEAQKQAMERAAVPEVFHEVVGESLGHGAVGPAIKALESGVEALPGHSRLRTRLAAMLLRQGRRPEAIEQLQKAMELDPMLPDAYGLMGNLRREEGAEKLDEAEDLLREAVRLAPGDVIQTSRLVWLLVDIARGVPERRAAAFEEARSLLDGLVGDGREEWEPHLLYAVLLREQARLTGEGDLGRASWFLKKARKLAPRRQSIEVRLDGELSLLDIAGGRLDDAERRLRKTERRAPSDARVYVGLSRLAEARGQLVVAHAEMQRAADRTAPHSLDRQGLEMELDRLRSAIEQGAGLAAAAPEAAAEAVADGTPAASEAAAAEAVAAETPVAAEPAPAEPAVEADPSEAPEAAAEAPADGETVEAPEAAAEAPAEAPEAAAEAPAEAPEAASEGEPVEAPEAAAEGEPVEAREAAAETPAEGEATPASDDGAETPR